MCNTSFMFHRSSFRCHRRIWVLVAILWVSCIPAVSRAQQPTATISTLRGTVFVNDQEQGTGTVLHAGDVIATQGGATVVLELSDGSLLELGENTNADIAELAQTATGAHISRVRLMWGRIRATLSPGHQQEGSSFTIGTPNAVVGVKFSQPDVEVSYDPAQQETVALALTVALAVKNLMTDEEKMVPVGSIAIITALGIKVMAGAAVATGAIAAESAAGEAAAGMSTGTKVAIGTGALAAAGGIAAVVASSGDNNSDIEAVVSSVHVFCVRFPLGGAFFPYPDDSYWVEAYLRDPHAIVERATISGSHVNGTSPLADNPDGRHPNEWWTDPNIFISQSLEPDFPLYYTVHISFKNGETRDVSKTVTTWEWAQ